MDSLQQWRSHQQQSDQHQHQPSAKAPKLHHPLDQQQRSPASSALALFAPDCNSRKATTITTPALSALPDSSTPSRSPRMGGFFSVVQWQELELQALIYKYMLAGAPVPPELILPIKRSLLSSSPYHHHPHQYQHFQLAMLQGGYWGRGAIDPEPGRCRRTDGKKWRCSRDVVMGHKYCERHVHRGRNRSRKHVEIPAPTGSSGSELTLPLNQRPLDGKTATGCSKLFPQELQSDKSDGRVLRSFFDDWPRTQQELPLTSSVASTPHLSISISGNSSSDFSLKLSTGNGDKPGPGSDKDARDGRMQPPMANWSGWGSHGEVSMGGPLAEALRSSASTPSPTSVLIKPNGGSASETSSISN